MRQLAAMAAVISFFALAFVGWINGVPVFICGMRALGGAVALYLVIGLGGRIAIRIIADAVVRAQVDRAQSEKGES